MKSSSLLVASGVLSVAAMAGVASLSAGASTSVRTEPGRGAVQVNLKDLPPVETATSRSDEIFAPDGRVHVLIKTASWCRPCQINASMAHVVATARKNPSVQYDVFAVAETEGTIRRLAKQAQTLPNVAVRYVFDAADQAAVPGELRNVLPAVAVVEPDGTVRATGKGAPEVARLLK